MRVPTGRAALMLCLTFLTLGAAPFSNIFYFGDSLSDTGNIDNLTFGVVPGSPYAAGRFSNGPVWVDYFAYLNGMSSTAPAAGMLLDLGLFDIEISGDGGNNYAIGGAKTGYGGSLDAYGAPSGVLWQVEYYLDRSGGVSDADALYVLFAGGNDIRDIALAPADQRESAAATAAVYIAYSAYLLAQSGATEFLILNAPNIGNTPESLLVRDNAAAATAVTQAFNSNLGMFMDFLPAFLPGTQFHYLDTYSLFEWLYEDAVNGGPLTGITNATQPCFAGYAGSPGADCSVSLFADDLHPTSLVHLMLAYGAHALVSSAAPALTAFSELSPGAAPRMDFAGFAALLAVPEPGSAGLVGLCLIAAALAPRKRARR